MSQGNLIKIYTLSGILGFLFFIIPFLSEIGFLRIRNDDELAAFGLSGAIIFLSIFFIALWRKIYLHGSTGMEKIIIALAILLFLYSALCLYILFNFNLPMV